MILVQWKNVRYNFVELNLSYEIIFFIIITNKFYNI